MNVVPAAEIAFFKLRSARSYKFHNLPTTRVLILKRGEILQVNDSRDIGFFRGRKDVVAECDSTGMAFDEPLPGSIRPNNAKTFRTWGQPAAHHVQPVQPAAGQNQPHLVNQSTPPPVRQFPNGGMAVRPYQATQAAPPPQVVAQAPQALRAPQQPAQAPQEIPHTVPVIGPQSIPEHHIGRPIPQSGMPNSPNVIRPGGQVRAPSPVLIPPGTATVTGPPNEAPSSPGMRRIESGYGPAGALSVSPEAEAAIAAAGADIDVPTTPIEQVGADGMLLDGEY